MNPLTKEFLDSVELTKKMTLSIRHKTKKTPNSSATVNFGRPTAFSHYFIERTFDNSMGLALNLVENPEFHSIRTKALNKSALGNAARISLNKAFRVPHLVPNVSKLPITVKKITELDWGAITRF